MNKGTAIIIENFFDNFEGLKDCFKTIPLYTPKKLAKLSGRPEETWPGKRSMLLDVVPETKPLFYLFLNTFNQKLGPFFNGIKLHVMMSIHLRLAADEAKDWIHKDASTHDYSMIINLSKTNLNSGTSFFDSIDSSVANETFSSKFIQNRALLFDTRTPHRSIGNHGTSIEDGRLTMIGFFKEIT